MATQTTTAASTTADDEVYADAVECVLCYELTTDPVEVICCGDELCCPECRDEGDNLCPTCEHRERRMSAWPEW